MLNEAPGSESSEHLSVAVLHCSVLTSLRLLVVAGDGDSVEAARWSAHLCFQLSGPNPDNTLFKSHTKTWFLLLEQNLSGTVRSWSNVTSFWILPRWLGVDRRIQELHVRDVSVILQLLHHPMNNLHLILTQVSLSQSPAMASKNGVKQQDLNKSWRIIIFNENI